MNSARMIFSQFPRDQLLSMVPKQTWVHSIDLGSGVVTPGLWGAGNPSITKALSDIDFANKKVLDVGCWDGLYSFEAERRGASEVYAIDLTSQRDFDGQPTFQIAHAALKSSVLYYPSLSVYDVERLDINDFDVVIFTGVYYHLKDPLRALTCLRRVLREGGLLLVEGAILDEPGCFARFFYRESFCGDSSNWWVPTIECLRQWVTCSFFKIVAEYERGGHLENQRHTLLAEAVLRDDPLYSRVPLELERFRLHTQERD
jgi:tRNA (mo5U34)-methyltransferase